MSDALFQKHNRFIISSCLVGIFSRYNGEQSSHDGLEKLIAQGRAIPLCPEQLGGLATPRVPCERVGDKVLNKDGKDVTEEFVRGAHEALRIVKLAGADAAILKHRSPTCGSGKIYDGTFSGNLVDGDGMFVELLKAEGIPVYSELDLED